MRGFVGIGQSELIETAVDEATNGLRNADLLILIAPYAKAEKAASLLAGKYPSVPMIGTTGASIGKSETIDSQITVIGFAGVAAACGLIEDVQKAPVNYIKDFENNLKSIDAQSDNTICMEFVTGSEEKTISTISSVLNRYDIQLAGGSAYGSLLGEKPIVIYNGKTYHGSCVYAFIRNNAGKIRLFRENVYEKLSTRPHFATLVDSNTKTLFQLDEQPAHDIYTQETGADTDTIVENMVINPLGRLLGNEIYPISTSSLDMNGVMFNQKAIYENDSIYIMQPGDIKQINEDTRSRIKNSSGRVSFIFSIDSVKRLKLLANEDYLQEYIRSMSELGSFAALISDGQQYNNQHMNQTMVCAVFE